MFDEIFGASVLFVIVFVAGFLVAIPFVAQQRRINKAWGVFATELGLQFKPDDSFHFKSDNLFPNIQGEVGGRWMALTMKETGGDTPMICTCMDLAVRRPDVLHMSICKATVLSNIGILFGMQSIKLGDGILDAKFKSRFIVKGTPVNVVKRIFTSEVGGAISKLPRLEYITLDNQRLHYEGNGKITSVDELGAILAALMAMARAIESNCQSS